MRLETERLLIRPFEPKDLKDVFNIYRDEKTCQYLLHEPWTDSTAENYFKKRLSPHHLSEDNAISLACVIEDKVIGDIAIWYTEMKDTVEIGYTFNKNYSGHGYATEAVRSLVDYLFKVKKVHRIQANLDSRNLASKKLCERIGMRQEAHFIADFWNKDEWTSSYIYAMLQSDLDEGMKE